MTEKNNKRTLFGWSMYDWAKSAYETTTLGAVMPVYFVSVVVPEEGFEFRGNLYTGAEVWGFAIGSALFIFFLIMPTIGAIGDLSGSRMRLFKSFAYGGAIFASTFFFAHFQTLLELQLIISVSHPFHQMEYFLDFDKVVFEVQNL